MGSGIFTCCFSISKAQKITIALHLAFLTSQKLLNLEKEWGIYDVFGVRGSMFDEG